MSQAENEFHRGVLQALASTDAKLTLVLDELRSIGHLVAPISVLFQEVVDEIPNARARASDGGAEFQVPEPC